MRLPTRWSEIRDLAWTVGPALIIVVVAFWVAAQFIEPAPPKEFIIATSSRGSPYYEAALQYQAILAANGVTLTLRETRGSTENLSLISDPGSQVMAGFVQGGLVQGMDMSNILSLGRIFYEPIWMFHRRDLPAGRLSDLAGRRILIGPAGSGTAILARRLLKASGVTDDTATLINMELPEYVAALAQGQADAGLLVLAPEARTVRRLLENPEVRLLNVLQADAYIQRFPFLMRLDLKRGVVDFARDQPPADTALLATTTALVVRKDLHPALADLLAQAVLETHAPPRRDSSGETALFQRAGVFPIADDQEFSLSDDAVRVYKSGPPFLQRYLPFWLATLVDRLFVLALPALGILLPVFKAAPAIYQWRIRRRIQHWYRELIKIEAEINSAPDHTALPALSARLRSVEHATERLMVPVTHVSELYELRCHLDVVRRRLDSDYTLAP